MTDPNPVIVDIFDSIRNMWDEDECPSWPPVRDKLVELIDVHAKDAERLRTLAITVLTAPVREFKHREPWPDDDMFPGGDAVYMDTAFGTYSIIRHHSGEWILQNEGMSLRERHPSKDEAIAAGKIDYASRSQSFLLSLV